MKRAMLIVSIVIVLAVFGIFFFEKVRNDRQPLVQNARNIQNVQSASESVSSDSSRDAISNGENKDVEKSQLVPTAGYKIVRVSDGKTAFSFEVPEKWLVETRHDGEKQLSIDEMREFLATNYDGDIKNDPDFTSDYSDYDWNSLKSLSENKIRDQFFRKDPKSGYMIFPNASVSASAQIWYTDTSWEQVDFFIRNSAVGSAVAEKKNSLVCTKEDIAIGNVYLCGSDAPQWGKASVGEKTADVLTYKTDTDERGKEAITKGGTGGKEYYIPLSSEKTLVISKQAKGDAQYEKDFDHLVATLKFE